MKIKNPEQAAKALQEVITVRIQIGLESLVNEMIETELPKGHGSSIADKIKIIHKQTTTGGRTTDIYELQCNDVWVWLNDGTGVHSGGKHAGLGQNGAIVPIYVKKLRFRNAKLAKALGFPSDVVFLSKVKGIKPRFFWDRYFRPARVIEAIAAQ